MKGAGSLGVLVSEANESREDAARAGSEASEQERLHVNPGTASTAGASEASDEERSVSRGSRASRELSGWPWQ